MFFTQGLGGDQHYVDGEHNDDYDHNAFLGRDEAKRLEDLSPEESLEELGYVSSVFLMFLILPIGF